MNSRPENRLTRESTGLPEDCAFTRDNIEGFALDALDRFERGLVEHHLRWCESCRAEAAAYEHVVERLPYALAAGPAPSPNVKAALFERIRSADAAETSVPRTTDHRTSVRDLAPIAARNGGSSWWRNASAALVAPLALAVLVMGVWANSLNNELDERDIDIASQNQLNEALASGGQVALYSVEREASCPTCNGSGQLGMSQSNDMGMVLGWNFDPNQRHDVWGVSQDGNRTKMCELKVDPTGAVMQMFTFPGGPETFTEVYITDEHGAMTYVSHLTQGDAATPDETPRTVPPTT